MSQLSDKQRMLLLKGCQNGGRITVDMATRFYSSKESGRSALSTLEFHGFIVLDVPGVFRIVKLPESVKERFREIKERQEE